MHLLEWTENMCYFVVRHSNNLLDVSLSSFFEEGPLLFNAWMESNVIYLGVICSLKWPLELSPCHLLLAIPLFLANTQWIKIVNFIQKLPIWKKSAFILSCIHYWNVFSKIVASKNKIAKICVEYALGRCYLVSELCFWIWISVWIVKE